MSWNFLSWKECLQCTYSLHTTWNAGCFQSVCSNRNVCYFYQWQFSCPLYSQQFPTPSCGLWSVQCAVPTRFFFSQKCYYELWGPPSILFGGYQWWSVKGVKLRSHQSPRLVELYFHFPIYILEMHRENFYLYHQNTIVLRTLTMFYSLCLQQCWLFGSTYHSTWNEDWHGKELQ